MHRLAGLISACYLSLAAGLACGSPEWKWSLQNGFDGGEVLSLAAGDGILLASTRQYGVYKSADTGRTWRPQGTRPLRMHFLEFDSASHLFYGVGDSSLFSAGPQTGEWTRLLDFNGSGSPFGDFSHPGMASLTKLSVHGKVLILMPGAAEGVRVSRDGGKTWRSRTYPAISTNILSVLAADSCVYAASSDSAVTISCDGGATWRFAGGDSTTNYGYGLARHGGSVLVSSGYGVFRSDNRGRTWIPWNSNLQDTVVPGNSRVWGLKNRGNLLFASRWDDQGGASVVSLHRSADGGSRWSSLATYQDRLPIVWTPNTWLEAAELGAYSFFPSMRGVMRSSGGNPAWSHVRGLGDAGILSLSIQGRRMLALTDSGLFVTADSGLSWDAALRSDAATAWTALSGANGLFATLSRQGGVRVSENSGATWNPIPMPAPGPAKHLAVLGRSLYLVANGSLWRSGPDGAAWTEIPLPAADSIRLMAGGTRSLLLCAQSHVWEYRESDGFSDRGGSLPSFDIARAWLIGDDAYVVAKGELHAREASTGDWVRISGHEGYPYSLAGLGSWLVVGTNAGPQISADGGRTWEKNLLVKENPMRKELPWVFALDGDRLYAGDDAGGIWRLDPVLPVEATSIRILPGRTTSLRAFTGARLLLEERKVRPDGRAYRPVGDVAP